MDGGDFDYDLQGGAEIAQEVSIALADGRAKAGLSGEHGAAAMSLRAGGAPARAPARRSPRRCAARPLAARPRHLSPPPAAPRPLPLLSAGGETGAEAARRLRARLDELDKLVRRLEASLADMEVGGRTPVAARALAQRREAVKKLALEARKLREREHASAFAATSDREALLSAGGGKSYGRETELTREMTSQEMVQRANVEIKNQCVRRRGAARRQHAARALPTAPRSPALPQGPCPRKNVAVAGHAEDHGRRDQGRDGAADAAARRHGRQD